jgi:hypothetical protein
MGESWLVFDIKNLRVTLYGDGNTRINMSTWEIVWKGGCAATSLPLEKSGNEPALSD